jgi:subtilisin family serine protease
MKTRPDFPIHFLKIYSIAMRASEKPGSKSLILCQERDTMATKSANTAYQKRLYGKPRGVKFLSSLLAEATANTKTQAFLFVLVAGIVMLGDMGTVLATSEAAEPQSHNEDILSLAGASDYGALLDKAERQGPVRVIVELQGRFEVEGSLVTPQAAQAQRDVIAALQDGVLHTMVTHNVSSVKRFTYIPYLAMEVDAAALEALRASPEVVSISEDIPVPPTLMQSVPLIGAPRAWTAGFSGAGQAIAILDSGVDKTHPFLAGKVVAEACFSTTTATPNGTVTTVCPNGQTTRVGNGAGINCPTTIDGCEHGTHVAGIAAGKGTDFSGVARDANIIGVQVFSRFNSPRDCTRSSAPCIKSFTSDMMRGLEFVYGLRNTWNIAAVNMSLGGGKFATYCDTDPRKAMIDNLRSVGIATVISSGNDGFADGISAPACISSAISVGTTTKSDLVANFSNSAPILSLLAPGVVITSSVPGGGFAALDGTSMAAPHVAGAWAILKSQKPSASVSESLTALVNMGKPITDPRNGLTKPRIQVDAAVGLGTGNVSNNDLVVDFGSAYGIWTLLNMAQWRQVHPLSAREIEATNFDGR